MAGDGGSKLPYGPGSKLWEYWMNGPGAAKWKNSPHPWRTLRAALLAAGVPAHMVDGLTQNMLQAAGLR